MQWFCTQGKPSLALALAAAASAAAPAFARPPALSRTPAAVMRVEHEWLEALHRHDVNTLARILGREFIDSDSQGEAITRAQYLTYFTHLSGRHTPCVRQVFKDSKVRFVSGGNVAIVTGVVLTWSVASNSGSSATTGSGRHSRFTDVFVWRDARWQAVAGQETHFTPKTD